MEYPHRLYLLYLLSRRMTQFEILADCEAKSLLPPTDGDLQDLSRQLGQIPRFWAARVEKKNVPFRRWLRDADLLEIWVGGDLQERATTFLYSGELRTSFQQLMVAHGDVERAGTDLRLKFGARRIPPNEVLDRFQTYFWNLGLMSREGLFHYLKAVNNALDPKRDPALRGDIATVYGQLGMRQRVEDEQFYDDLIAFAHNQINLGRQATGLLKGGDSLGVAALARQALDAIKARADMRTVGGQVADDIKKQAAMFKLRSGVQTQIISIDDLRGDTSLLETEEEDSDGPATRRFAHPVQE